MSRLIAHGVLIVALSFSTMSMAAEHRLPAKHHAYMLRSTSDVVIKTPPPFFPVGFISNGTNFEDGGANGLSGDDSYGPPLGFHGGLSQSGVTQPGPGGPFDRVSGCGSQSPC
jgi:hypothetical protein